VLHAGFYYTADSLKARFTREGNEAMRDFCQEYDIPLNQSGKIVVAANAEEDAVLETLMGRGIKNGVELIWMSKEELKQKYPNIHTYKRALFSPTTATVDPAQVTRAFGDVAEDLGVTIHTDCAYRNRIDDNTIETTCGTIAFSHLINAAGLYADTIAHDFDCGHDYTILPFKGIYLKDKYNQSHLPTNIYPVPNLANPFLGVHFTLTSDNAAKIGPTAIPAFWRENYKGLENFSLKEMIQILGWEARLFISNDFGFRALAIEEIKKYSRIHLKSLAAKLTNKMSLEPYNQWSTPGIRAQLLNIQTHELVQDFVVEHNGNTTHILNAVSPAFTASIPFAWWVVEGL
jgi:L-2-hydroxyglutarate oxidase LhgO